MKERLKIMLAALLNAFEDAGLGFFGYAGLEDSAHARPSIYSCILSDKGMSEK